MLNFGGEMEASVPGQTGFLMDVSVIRRSTGSV